MAKYYVEMNFGGSPHPYTKSVDAESVQEAESKVKSIYPKAISIGPTYTEEEYRAKRKEKELKDRSKVIVEAMGEYKNLREQARQEELERNKDRKEYGEWA